MKKVLLWIPAVLLLCAFATAQAPTLEGTNDVAGADQVTFHTDTSGMTVTKVEVQDSTGGDWVEIPLTALEIGGQNNVYIISMKDPNVAGLDVDDKVRVTWGNTANNPQNTSDPVFHNQT